MKNVVIQMFKHLNTALTK